MNETQPKYEHSHALVIGINRYSKASPLHYAVNDANEVSDVLSSKLGFTSIKLLLDEEATRDNIHREYLSFAGDKTTVDDRLIVFFAGHGHTERSRRGDVGYLVPHDGTTTDLSTLLRWDAITRDADLINAKHILFVMDACYGGLAITRAMKPGASRFLKDMLQRYSRQVLTAGKADELVGDSGGPRADHSVFTGHFLDAISGAAASNGILTANGVMAYVYQSVSTDPDSTQTPHYGYLQGDGDFIFTATALLDVDTSDKKEIDVLIPVPGTQQVVAEIEVSVVETAKSLLANPENRIRLHELVAGLTRSVISQTATESFAPRGAWSPSEFAERLAKYNKEMQELRSVEMLMGFWATEAHSEILAMPAQRLSERNIVEGGITAWLALRWYPVLLLVYSCGLGAIAAQKYSNLLTLLHARIPDPRQRTATTPVIKTVFSEIYDIVDAFKTLPGHERQYVPVSEYLFKELQPTADDVLFIGGGYENLFDQLEILIALQLSFLDGGWSPLGRFAWKHSSRRHGFSPLQEFVEEAEKKGNKWLPIQAGFFNGSIEEFRKSVSAFNGRIEKLNWF